MAKSGRVKVEGLGELGRRLSRLGNAIPDAIQAAVDDTAELAIVAIADPMDAAAQNGLTPFMQVKPGKTTSAVRPSRRQRGAKQGVAQAEVRVRDRQSAIYKYLLDGPDDDDMRQPGDVGMAEKHVFVVRSPNVLRRYQGIRATKYGNLPRSTLKTLIARAGQKTTADDRGSKEDLFFGSPRGSTTKRSEAQIGFWQRPVNVEKGGLMLMIEAIPQADYSDVGQFDRAWNEGITDAVDRLPARSTNAIDEAVRIALKARVS